MITVSKAKKVVSQGSLAAELELALVLEPVLELAPEQPVR